MSEARALELGYTPKAVLKAWSYSAVDPFEDLLLGPTFATSSLLKQAGLTLKDVDVVEFHEAFAGQVRERDIYTSRNVRIGRRRVLGMLLLGMCVGAIFHLLHLKIFNFVSEF